jgi:hypothetical protein
MVRGAVVRRRGQLLSSRDRVAANLDDLARRVAMAVAGSPLSAPP